MMDNFHPFGSVERRMEVCLLGKEEFLLPDSILEQSSIFKDVVSLDTWKDHLSDAQRKHLLRFLPTFPENDRAEKEETLNLLLTGETFKFGNPLKQFHTRLRDGYFSPDISKYAALCRQAKHREYKIQQQNYYSRLLREILLSRERVLDEVRQLPPDEHPKFCYVPPKTKRQTMEGKVTRKYVKLLKDVRAECGVEETSSEEEDLPAPVPRSKRQAAKALFPLPSPEPTVPNVLSTLDPKPQINGDIKPITPAEPGSENVDRAAVRQTVLPTPRVMRGLRHAEITEEQYRELLKKHKKRRLENSDSPDLDTKNLTLQDIISRCQALPKKPPSRASPATQAANAKKRFRIRPRPMKKLLLAHKRSADEPLPHEIQTDITREAPEVCVTEDDEADIEENMMNIAEEENLPELMVDSERALTVASGGQYDSFFSMLRDYIMEFPEAKVTTPKLEEKVREWQDSDAAVMNAWFPAQNSWIDTVISALKFLSSDALEAAKATDGSTLASQAKASDQSVSEEDTKEDGSPVEPPPLVAAVSRLGTAANPPGTPCPAVDSLGGPRPRASAEDIGGYINPRPASGAVSAAGGPTAEACTRPCSWKPNPSGMESTSIRSTCDVTRTATALQRPHPLPTRRAVRRLNKHSEYC